MQVLSIFYELAFRNILIFYLIYFYFAMLYDDWHSFGSKIILYILLIY